MMNTDTLNTIDTMYLKAFQQNLLYELRRARITLKQLFSQSKSLAFADELLPAFRHNYEEITEHLLPLIEALSGMESDIDGGSLSWEGAMQPDEGNSIETGMTEEPEKILDRLDTTELEILDVLNEIGERLAIFPHSIVSWSDCGLFSVHVELKPLPERPCYDLQVPIDIHTQPDFCADYFARKNIDKNLKKSQWPHYLVDEVMPLTLLPLIEDLWIEMDVHGDGYAWRTSSQQQGTQT